MAYTDFPNGVTSFGVPQIGNGQLPLGRKYLFVDAAANGGSNGNEGGFDSPYGSITFALTKCAANRGDVIGVKQGYALSITTHDQVAINVAGVTVIGLGQGDDRPTLTWDGTDATASIVLSAANASFQNFLLVSSDTGDDITGMIRIEADNCEVAYNEFREGTGQPESAILVADAVNRAHVHHNKATSLTNGAAANDAFLEFITLATGGTGHRVHHNYVHGTYDEACIWSSDGTAGLLDVAIHDNILINTATGEHAISLLGSLNTGVITGNKVSTTSESISIEGGGAELIDNRWGLNTLQSVNPGQSTGAPLVSIASGMRLSTGDELAVVTAGGPIIIKHIAFFTVSAAENNDTVVLDNIVTGASGDLYGASQEFDIEADTVGAGDVIVAGQGGFSLMESAGQVEDSRGLNWLVQASDTIDITGAGAEEVEGVSTAIITYESLGGELEVE